jgi:hypothetical protein
MIATRYGFFSCRPDVHKKKAVIGTKESTKKEKINKSESKVDMKATHERYKQELTALKINTRADLESEEDVPMSEEEVDEEDVADSDSSSSGWAGRDY